MRQLYPRGRLSVAALAAAFLAGCATGPTEAEKQAERAAYEAAVLAAKAPPPIALNQSVVQAAAVYMTFSREMAALEGGFTSPEQIQAALRRGASYDPDQISRGLVAYASILALQSPEFVAGVRSLGGDRDAREKLVADIVADPVRATRLPGAAAAAGLVMTTLGADIGALGRAADSIENDAYAIQARFDPRRSWGVAAVSDRAGRLEAAKARSTAVQPSAEETSRLFAAAHSGGGTLPVSGDPRQPPYPAAVVNALALAALASLGYAGENARANTDALQFDRVSQGCLSSSKLNLFQCLAASRPNYEDMFCLGRHIVRDLATCSRGAAMPAAIVTVSDVTAEPAPKASEPDRGAEPARQPAITIAPAAPGPVAPEREPSLTERLNSGPATPSGARPGRSTPLQ